MAIWQSILPSWISNLIPSATNWNNKASVHPNGHCLEHSPRHSPDIDQSEVIFEESFGASSRNHSFYNKYLITAKYMLLKIVPRYQNLKWKIWWPTMMAKTCHLLFWWQRALTNLAACCSKIWRNPKIWCFPLSACQLRLPCSPLAPRIKPSPRWCLPVFRSPTLKTSQELRMLLSVLFIVRSLCFDVLCQKCQQFHNFYRIVIWRCSLNVCNSLCLCIFLSHCLFVVQVQSFTMSHCHTQAWQIYL